MIPMRKIKVIAAAAAITGAIALTGASSASALNVGTIGTPVGSGTMAHSAPGGPARLSFTTNVGSGVFYCPTAGLALSIATGAYAVPANIGTAQLQFGGCIGPGNLPYGITCATSTTFQIMTAPAAGSADGQLSGISCVITVIPLGCTATLTGSVPVRYANPTGSSAAVTAVQALGQMLTISGSTCPPVVIWNGPARLGAPGSGALGISDLALTLTGAPSTHPFLS